MAKGFTVKANPPAKKKAIKKSGIMIKQKNY